MEAKDLKNEIEKHESESALAVVDNESYALAGLRILGWKKLQKKVDEFFDGNIKKANILHKDLIAQKNELAIPIKVKIGALDKAVSDYLTEQERIRKEEQRRIDEARRKAEEAERAKLAKQAERAEAAGKAEKAEALREKVEEVYIPPAIVETVERTTRTDAGTVTAKTDIEIEITDHKKILKHIIDGILPLSIVAISEPKLKATLKLHQITQLDGVHIREVSKAQYRGR